MVLCSQFHSLHSSVVQRDTIFNLLYLLLAATLAAVCSSLWIAVVVTSRDVGPWPVGPKGPTACAEKNGFTPKSLLISSCVFDQFQMGDDRSDPAGRRPVRPC